MHVLFDRNHPCEFLALSNLFLFEGTGVDERAFKRRARPRAPARLPHRKSRRKQSIEYHNAYANRNETLYPER